MKLMLAYKKENLLSYSTYGDKNGFPILIQHGLIASIDDQALFHRLVELGAHVICVARPGYGDSTPYAMHRIAEWGDIISLLVEELRLGHFDVLGLSSGAPYSYAIGYKLPKQVRNIYIFSGIPALYEPRVVAQWPYPITRNATIPEMQALALELFFSNISEHDLGRNDVQDSMRNNCFGIALDLKLRAMDWGFTLSEVQENVYMRHSRFDNAAPVTTAEITSNLLPHCRLEIREGDVHFSEQALDDFIETVIAPQYESGNTE